MKNLQSLYSSFDTYLAWYTRNVVEKKSLLYRQKEGIQVLMTNLGHFFTEEQYTPEVFKRYEQLFQKDTNYLQELLLENEGIPPLLHTSSYTKLLEIEKIHTFLKNTLDVFTITLRRILVR